MAGNTSHDNSVDISRYDTLIVLALAGFSFFLLFVVAPTLNLG